MSKTKTAQQTAKSAQDILNEWGARKYPNYAGKVFTLEVESRSEGYCETCYSEWDELVIKADGMQVDSRYEVAISDMLMEILGDIANG